MEADWIKIYSTPEWFKADLLIHLLEQENLEVVKLNKKDSTYLSFGIIELYVHKLHFTRAIELILMNEENLD